MANVVVLVHMCRNPIGAPTCAIVKPSAKPYPYSSATYWNTMIVATVVDHDDNNRISIVGEGNVMQLKASEIPRSSRIGRDNDKIADRGGISDPHITASPPTFRRQLFRCFSRGE